MPLLTSGEKTVTLIECAESGQQSSFRTNRIYGCERILGSNPIICCALKSLSLARTTPGHLDNSGKLETSVSGRLKKESDVFRFLFLLLTRVEIICFTSKCYFSQTHGCWEARHHHGATRKHLLASVNCRAGRSEQWLRVL